MVRAPIVATCSTTVITPTSQSLLIFNSQKHSFEDEAKRTLKHATKRYHREDTCYRYCWSLQKLVCLSTEFSYASAHTHMKYFYSQTCAQTKKLVLLILYSEHAPSAVAVSCIVNLITNLIIVVKSTFKGASQFVVFSLPTVLSRLHLETPAYLGCYHSPFHVHLLGREGGNW